jgi:polyphosphate kinase 2
MSTIDQTEEGPRNLISLKDYEAHKYLLQIELLKWQNHVKETNTQHIIIFEGRDAAGKGGAIKRFMEHLNPRTARVVALNKPTEMESKEWYWQRYIAHFPHAGEITLWDRSWYNRAGVESVLGFTRESEIERFFSEARKLERIWQEANIQIIKFWYSVNKKEQARRFKERETHPLKIGKLSEIDLISQDKWDEYTKAKDRMFRETENWVRVKSNCKRSARIASMQYVLLNNEYEGKSLENIGEINPTILSVQNIHSFMDSVNPIVQA